MALTLVMFSSFDQCTLPHILMGNNTYISVTKRGSINIDDDTFNYVLCVPSLSSNLISIYHITHSGKCKTIKFTHDLVLIRDLHGGGIIVARNVDHAS